MEPWRLSELNYGRIKGEPPFAVAVLPLGVTEPHNLHLPYGTDTFQVEVIAARACAWAYERGARVVLLPALPYGTETNQMRFPMAMNLNPSTLARVIADLVDSLGAHGVDRCLILNGHGGNDLKWVLRELHRSSKVHLFLCNWYKMIADVYPTLFGAKDDHAGEMETSIMLNAAPGLVLPLSEAGSGKARRFRVRGLREGWAWAPRQWTKVTDDTGTGNPAAASAQKGRTFLDALARRIGDFLVELAAADPADLYE